MNSDEIDQANEIAEIENFCELAIELLQTIQKQVTNDPIFRKEYDKSKIGSKIRAIYSLSGRMLEFRDTKTDIFNGIQQR